MPNCDLEKQQDNPVIQPNEEKTETDNVTSSELQRNRRILYFSDGTMEEASDNEMEFDVPDKSLDININESELSFIPLIKCKAHKIGSNILSGIDYVGGGLANFLGITTSKYANEMEYYQRSEKENKNLDSENETWRTKKVNNNLEEVITAAPIRQGTFEDNQ